MKTKTFLLALSLIVLVGVTTGAALAATKPKKANPNVIDVKKAKLRILDKIQTMSQQADDDQGFLTNHIHLVKCSQGSKVQLSCAFSVSGVVAQDAYTGESQTVICKGHAQANLVKKKIRVTILDWQFNNNSCSIISTGAGESD